MNAPLTIPATRAWLGTCNCPPDKCMAKTARECKDWIKRNKVVVSKKKQA